MKKNEIIVVSHYSAETVEDSFENGEVGEVQSMWSERDLPVSGEFDTVADALKAVCDANGLDFIPDDWENWLKNYGEEPGRYDGSFLVDAHNCKASDSERESWKKGEMQLYSLRLSVHLVVRSVERPLELDDMDM